MAFGYNNRKWTKTSISEWHFLSGVSNRKGAFVSVCVPSKVIMLRVRSGLYPLLLICWNVGNECVLFWPQNKDSSDMTICRCLYLLENGELCDWPWGQRQLLQCIPEVQWSREPRPWGYQPRVWKLAGLMQSNVFDYVLTFIPHKYLLGSVLILF